MNEHVIMAILEYIEHDLFEPSITWPIDIREKRVYSRWAAYEIVQCLMDNPFDDPRLLIEKFEVAMIVYSKMYDPHKECNMFAIAADVANDILKGDF